MCSDAATWTLFLDLPWDLCSAPARKSHLRLHMTNEKVQGNPERDTGRMEVYRETAGETPCNLSFIQGAYHFFLLDVLHSLCRKHRHTQTHTDTHTHTQTHTHTHTLPNFLCLGLHRLTEDDVASLLGPAGGQVCTESAVQCDCQVLERNGTLTG